MYRTSDVEIGFIFFVRQLFRRKYSFPTLHPVTEIICYIIFDITRSGRSVATAIDIIVSLQGITSLRCHNLIELN